MLNSTLDPVVSILLLPLLQLGRRIGQLVLRLWRREALDMLRVLQLCLRPLHA